MASKCPFSLSFIASINEIESAAVYVGEYLRKSSTEKSSEKRTYNIRHYSSICNKKLLLLRG